VTTYKITLKRQTAAEQTSRTLYTLKTFTGTEASASRSCIRV